MTQLPSREHSLTLLHEFVQNPSLRRHCLAVATSMEAYAKKQVPAEILKKFVRIDLQK